MYSVAGSGMTISAVAASPKEIKVVESNTNSSLLQCNRIIVYPTSYSSKFGFSVDLLTDSIHLSSLNEPLRTASTVRHYA